MIGIDMDMPKSCSDCLLRDRLDCIVTGEFVMENPKEQSKNCPIKGDIVYCKDCIWRYHDVIDGEESDWCAIWANEVADKDDFCSYGKRKADQDD